MFQHLLLTLFNTNRGVKDRRGKDIRTKEWMDYRIGLFEKYCFPSIKLQENKNFNWLVFFDTKTLPEHKNTIASWQKNLQIFVPIFISDSSGWKTKIIDHVQNDTKFLITTRLDNDDALSKESMGVIQSNFCQQNIESINLTKGYILQGNKAFKEEEHSNPFISLIEKINKKDEIKTVWCKQHLGLNKIAPIKQINDKAYWLRVIHEKNISNQTKGIPCELERIFEDFSYLRE